MCAKLMYHVIHADLDLSGPVKSTLLYLAGHYHPERKICNPSAKCLSVESGYSVRTIKRSIAELIDRGLIITTNPGDGRHSNRYLFSKKLSTGQLTRCHSDTPPGATQSSYGATQSSYGATVAYGKVIKGNKVERFNNSPTKTALRIGEISKRFLN